MTEEEKHQKRLEAAKRYRQKKKEEIKQKKHEYYLKHKDELIEANMNYYNNHIEEYKEIRAAYKKRTSIPCVYMYREIESGKIAYIGSTKDIGRRKANRKYGTGVPFDKIYKENPYKFELFIIGKYESIDIAREEEIKCIQKLKPLYNIKHNH